MDIEMILRETARLAEVSPTNYLSPPATDEASRKKQETSFTANNFYKHNMPNGGDAASLDKDKTDEYVGMRFYEAPILSIGAADDPGFLELKRPEVVGPHIILPTEWLPEAKSVITLFLPFTERVIRSNTVDPTQPSWEWMFTRVDGQQHLLATAQLVKELLEAEGYQAVVPQTDDRYIMRTAQTQDLPIPVWNTNWSERHAAYITGMGTFGRMTNLITERGCCGRLVSIVTDWETAPTPKDYSGLYDYCADCGACYRACPGHALSAAGKDKQACAVYLHTLGMKYKPRYGCGKCQSGLPCSTRCFKKTK